MVGHAGLQEDHHDDRDGDGQALFGVRDPPPRRGRPAPGLAHRMFDGPDRRRQLAETMFEPRERLRHVVLRGDAGGFHRVCLPRTARVGGGGAAGVGTREAAR